jgi:hypothetical protein
LATVVCPTSMPSLSSSPWMRVAPQSGLARLNLPNELADVLRDFAAGHRAIAGANRPESPNGASGSRCRRDNLQCRKRRRNQPRQPTEQQAIDVVESRLLWRLAPEHVDLVAKNQDLGFTPCARPEQPNECAKKQSEQSNHRTRASYDSLSCATRLGFPTATGVRRRAILS